MKYIDVYMPTLPESFKYKDDLVSVGGSVPVLQLTREIMVELEPAIGDDALGWFDSLPDCYLSLNWGDEAFFIGLMDKRFREFVKSFQEELFPWWCFRFFDYPDRLNMKHIDFSYADICWMGFECDLNFSNFECSDLSCADFDGSDLSHANLRHCFLMTTRMKHSIVDETDFRGAFFDNKTKFPDGFDPIQRGCYHYSLFEEADSYLKSVVDDSENVDVWALVDLVKSEPFLFDPIQRKDYAGLIWEQIRFTEMEGDKDVALFRLFCELSNPLPSD